MYSTTNPSFCLHMQCNILKYIFFSKNTLKINQLLRIEITYKSNIAKFSCALNKDCVKIRIFLVNCN